MELELYRPRWEYRYEIVGRNGLGLRSVHEKNGTLAEAKLKLVKDIPNDIVTYELTIRPSDKVPTRIIVPYPRP